MRKRALATGICVALMLPGSALAAPGHGKGGPPHGEKKKAPSHKESTLIDVDVHIGTEARQVIADYYHRHSDCPPGLAKKRNGCLPPGQAKKAYTIGKRLPPDMRGRRLPPDLGRYLPPPPAGYLYSFVDGDVLLVAEATHRVVDAVVAVNAALNAVGR